MPHCFKVHSGDPCGSCGKQVGKTFAHSLLAHARETARVFVRCLACEMLVHNKTTYYWLNRKNLLICGSTLPGYALVNIGQSALRRTKKGYVEITVEAYEEGNSSSATSLPARPAEAQSRLPSLSGHDYK
eukprot:6173930-Pleurochrysis_carterae.AAC.4